MGNEYLRKLNSMTKYPPIETFHELGERGMLNNVLTRSGLKFAGRTGYSATEKIDGTNARGILMRLPRRSLSRPIDWFLGSRDQLLTARGDRIPNPTEGIVEHLSLTVETISCKGWADNAFGFGHEVTLLVVYWELYGGNIVGGGGAKNYSCDGSVGLRVLDMRMMTQHEYMAAMEMSVDEIALKRERGVLPGRWLTDEERLGLCMQLGLETVPLLFSDTPIPEDVHGVYEWLALVAGEKTHAVIGTNEPGRPEGIVVRLPDRSAIAKFKFTEYERYERTLKIKP